MITGIDHAVVLVDNLESAIFRWRGAGFEVILGGRHRPAPTENAVIPFRDSSYIELFAFRRSYPEHRWWNLEKSGNVMDYSCTSTDIERDMEDMNSAGITSYPRQSLQRVLPSGDVADWWISVPRGQYAGVVPFLVGDVTSRTLRVPPAPVHLNGVVGIACIVIAVPSLRMVDSWCKNVAGWRYRLVDGRTDAVELRRHEQIIRFIVEPAVRVAGSPRIQLFLRTDTTFVPLQALIRG